MRLGFTPLVWSVFCFLGSVPVARVLHAAALGWFVALFFFALINCDREAAEVFAALAGLSLLSLLLLSFSSNGRRIV